MTALVNKFITAPWRLPSSALGMYPVTRWPHRSGGLADGTNAISLASANLKSVAAMSFGNEALVRLIPDDVDAARNVLRERNVPFEETDVTTVLLENKAGSLTELATELA